MAKNIKPRKEDYAQWYLDVIKAAQLADYSPVRGCMVIRPEGFAIWEAIQRDLDRRFKETGHVNAYFPLLIPQSFLAKEAAHVEGFAMECAVVTHSRLEKDPEKPGGLRPASPIDEPLIIRPTSETIFGHMYAQWIQSYRDLPVLINQWCNVMRWEMRTRLFLRTAEFLWQEGHTAHETAEEAQEETLRMLDVYSDFCHETLALPVVKGKKTEAEKFPGADVTYAIEGLMQDGKALQCGTSHNLGQNFAKAFDIKFLGRDQKQQHCWTTSWGASTRLIGATIMAHSDDEGLVLPPNVAPVVAAIVPIFKTDEERATVSAFVDQLIARLAGVPASAGMSGTDQIKSYFVDKTTSQRIVVDWRDARPGDKQYHWEQRGVPFRIEVGPRDVQANAFVLKRRLDREKAMINLNEVTSPQWLHEKLQMIHGLMLERARKFRDESTRGASSLDEMKKILDENGGFVRAYFEPDKATEARIKEQTKATVRCIPFDQPQQPGKDIVTGKLTATQVLFAQAYQNHHANARMKPYDSSAMSAEIATQSFSHYPSWPAPVSVALTTIPDHPCPYLPSRIARSRAFCVDQLDPELYHDFMDAGFRRSGKLIYQPACSGCRECRPIRVCVDRFTPSKSQRRCLRRNIDLSVHIAKPLATDEKFDLYRRYIRGWHGRDDGDTRDDFESFLYDSPVQTLEFTYRSPDGALMAVGICDVCSRSLSSVYFYFDPAHARRGLGTFGALCEIRAARSWRLPHYYLGYYVRGCGAMKYKSNFRKAQTLDTAGAWRDIADES